MANFSEFTQFPTNLKWEMIPDCLCPQPNFNCWKPEIYAKPIECIPSYIDFNAPFHGIPQIDTNNSSNFWLHIQNGLGLILQVASLIFAILSYSSFRRSQLANNPGNGEERGQNNENADNFAFRRPRQLVHNYPPLPVIAKCRPTVSIGHDMKAGVSCVLCRNRRPLSIIPEEEETTSTENA